MNRLGGNDKAERCRSFARWSQCLKKTYTLLNVRLHIFLLLLLLPSTRIAVWRLLNVTKSGGPVWIYLPMYMHTEICDSGGNTDRGS